MAEHNAQVVQAKASLKQAETSLGYARIVSPVDGVVIARKVDVGQTMAASLQTPTLFSIARDLTRMQIEARVLSSGALLTEAVQHFLNMWEQEMMHRTITM